MNITQNNFNVEVLQSDVPVLLDFWAPWCGPCNALAPAIKELSDNFDGRTKVFKINVDEETGLADMHSISSIPALIYYKDGKEVKREVGVRNVQQLRENLEELC